MTEKSVKTTLQTIDERVAKMMNKHLLTGLGLGIVQDGKVIFAKGYGLANLASKEPLTADTTFRIASISKTFTAIAVMQLWEKKLFNLDDSINTHLRSYKIEHNDPDAPPVTIRQVLTHTSGVGELRDNKDLFKALVLKQYGTRYKPDDALPTLAEYYSGVLRPDVYPEKKWAYANNAYATLGQLVADLSGQSFASYMLEHVFEPLGMFKTDFDFSERVRHNLAQGYENVKGRLESAEHTIFPGQAAGTTYSSVNEMCLYLKALMNGGTNEHGTVLQPETLKMMMTPHFQPDEHLAGMGLGFHLENEDGHWSAWHGGAVPGFNSSLWVSPDDKLGLIVWSNTATRAIYSFGENLLRSLIGLEDFDSRLPKPGVIGMPHIWPRLVGIYQPYKGINSNLRNYLTYGGEMEVYIKDNSLMAKSLTGAWKDGVKLYPIANGNPYNFEYVSDGKRACLAFKENNLGEVDRLEISSLTWFTFYKVPPIRSLRNVIKAAGLAGATLGLWALSRAMKKPAKKSKCCCANLFCSCKSKRKK